MGVLCRKETKCSSSFAVRYHYDNVLSNFNDSQLHIYYLTRSFYFFFGSLEANESVFISGYKEFDYYDC